MSVSCQSHRFRDVPATSAPTGGTAASAGAHAFGLDHCDGRLRHQISHKRLGRFWFFAVRRDTCCVHDLPLYFGREWANHVQAGIVQHVKEEYGELGVAVGNRLDDLRGRWLRLALGFHLLGDELVYAGKLGAGGARRYRGDRLRLEQGLLESLRRANVGFRRTRADRDADTYPGDVGRRFWRDLCPRGSVFPNILRHDTKIEWTTARGHLDQFRGRAIANNDLMA